MKTFFAVLLVGIPLSVLHGAEITWVGADINRDPKFTSPGTTNALGWRNDTDPKPLDIDGDNIYGTSGYYMRGGQSVPSYMTSITKAGGGNTFQYINDPTDPAGVDDFSSGLWGDQSLNYGALEIYSFTISGTYLENKVLRVGTHYDCAQSYLTGTFFFEFSQTVGGSGNATSIVLTASANGCDWGLFDIKAPQDGDKFVMYVSDVGTSDTMGRHGFGGFAFDTMDIPPSGTVIFIK